MSKDGTENNPPIDENKLIAERREKLGQLRERGQAYPNHFKREDIAVDLHTAYGDKDREWFDANPIQATVAGRMMLKRVMGKASFASLQDRSERIQIYLKRDDLADGVYMDFKSWDIGDLLGASGRLFKTQKGELSVHVENIEILSKSLRPLPEKFHGLTNTEQRYRQRYVDLIVNDDVRKTFQMRSAIISYIRKFMEERAFLEVETPMMQVIPGGATARPFVTHHNALDMDLYLRIAPELYLKRLIVGGLERVFEINRNFRNEGLSTRHNPEFTMIEFYEAYATYEDHMDLTEELFRGIANEVLNTEQFTSQGVDYDFSKPFQRLTVKESILQYNPEVTAATLDDIEQARNLAESLKIPVKENYGLGKIQIEIFEKTVEEKLLQPTFITAYPAEVSPLARRNDDDPFITDRYEFFIGGKEIANGFSELNDPEDQASRFHEQVAHKDAGDDEAMHFDADYIRALEYGMPPTAGEGIGIDRLVMLFTDSPSIRDVLLFPHMKPE